MSNILRLVRRHKLLVIVGAIVLCALIWFGFYRSGSSEALVAQNNLTLAASQSTTDRFTYSGSTVNQSMTVGCKVPAILKINVQSVATEGTIKVFLNDKLYADGTISGTGEAMLSSGCGCSTICVCEIKVGDNVIKVLSSSFSGQVQYQIYVKQ